MVITNPWPPRGCHAPSRATPCDTVGVTEESSGPGAAHSGPDRAPGASGAGDVGAAGGGAAAGGTVRLRPPRHRVERRAVRWWTAQATLTVIPVLGALSLAAWWIPPARAWLMITMIAAAVLGAAYIGVMPRWRYRVHRYETTGEAVYTSSGWISQEWRVAPLSRIQTVDTVRGPLQRLFGLSSVTVTTASAAGALVIDGLDRRHATEIVTDLTAATQAVPGDAT